MRWYSLLFSIIFRSVIPNSSNHCNRQRIIIMYSYVCIMFYFCMHQNFVCHTKRVESVPSHHWPAKWSSVVSPRLILPRKIIVSPPSISPPVHADFSLHVTSWTVNQPREEAPCLRHQSVHSHPLEVALCFRHQSYQEKASCCCRQSVRPCTLSAVARKQRNHQPAKRSSAMSLLLIIPPVTGRSSVVLPPSIIPRKSIVLPPSISPPSHADSPSHVTSRTTNQPKEEALWLCRWSVHPGMLEVALCCLHQSFQEKTSFCLRWSVRSRLLICGPTSVAEPSTSREKKLRVSAVNQATCAH